MPRRRRRRSHSAAEPDGQPRVQPTVPAPQKPLPRKPEAPGRTKAPPVPASLKSSIELAAELAKKELSFRGKVGSLAVFIYEDNGAGAEDADRAGMVKTVSLSSRSELQREAVRKRIREKVLAETISTVVIAADGKKDRPAKGQKNPTVLNGSIVISGAMPSVHASASVTYSFDQGAKTFSLWDLRWLDTAVDNYFLQGVFGGNEGTSRSGGNRHRRNG